MFGKNYHFLLNEKEQIDYKGLNKFLKKFSKNKFFIFGFTSLVYKNLIQNLKMEFYFMEADGKKWKK